MTMTTSPKPRPRRGWRAATTALALLGPLAPAVASAATLSSPPVTQAGGNRIECAIKNVSATAWSVTIRTFENDQVLSFLTFNLGAKSQRACRVLASGSARGQAASS